MLLLVLLFIYWIDAPVCSFIIGCLCLPPSCVICIIAIERLCLSWRRKMWHTRRLKTHYFMYSFFPLLELETFLQNLSSFSKTWLTSYLPVFHAVLHDGKQMCCCWCTCERSQLAVWLWVNSWNLTLTLSTIFSQIVVASQPFDLFWCQWWVRESQSDRLTDRQTERQTERQVDRERQGRVL